MSNLLCPNGIRRLVEGGNPPEKAKWQCRLAIAKGHDQRRSIGDDHRMLVWHGEAGIPGAKRPAIVIRDDRALSFGDDGFDGRAPLLTPRPNAWVLVPLLISWEAAERL